ncbi:MAG: protoheme IX farnesyltransferase [Acidobacteria bacterium]|nr:protoheme IX farnesyltransferase [Acidobacteriota bacterium]
MPSTPSRVADWITLAKIRVNTLVVATTAGGYYMATPGDVDLARLAITCVGTALVAGGAAAFNQVSERDTDALMDRTRNRPVAGLRMSPREGRIVAAVLSAAGLGILGAAVSMLAMWVALATLFSYVLCYTPLKRYTSFSTVVGAVPGALPPMIGWAAARGSIDELAGWSLFFIMFIWQLPHFLAIAWIYREDYGRAGLPMLPVIDHSGAMTGRQMALWAATLVPVSVMPTVVNLADQTYGIGVLILGLMQFALTVRFAWSRTKANARVVFYASIIYLPLLWALMALAKLGN